LQAILPICPAAHVAAFASFQDVAYQSAVIKDPTVLTLRTKRVTTSFGDTALVVCGSGDGNCLPVAILRCLVNGGRPLSQHIERDGALALREAIAKLIESHNWPHEQVATPLTITACAEETREDGRWCGVVALAVFARVCNVELRLWQYEAKSESVITPVVVSGINEGADRVMVMHLLQSRTAPSQPERYSHWEAVIMNPPVIGAVGIVCGPGEVKNGNHYYEWLEDAGRKPVPLRVNQWDKVILRGRGKQGNTQHIVCELRSKGKKGVPQVIVVVTGKNDKLNVSARSVRDVVSIVAPAPTGDEVMQAKNELKQATAPTATEVEVAATIASSLRPVRQIPKKAEVKVETKQHTGKRSGEDNNKQGKKKPKTEPKEEIEEQKVDTPRTARMMKRIEDMALSFEQRHQQITQQMAVMQSSITSTPSSKQTQSAAVVDVVRQTPQSIISQRSIQDINVPSPPRVRSALQHMGSNQTQHYASYHRTPADRCLDLVDELLYNHRVSLRRSYYQ